MQYATAEEFEEEIETQETVELTNLANPSATTVNSDRLNKFLIAASGEINSFLATRYAIPVDPIPSILKTYCIDIACYRLAQNNPDRYEAKYNNAIARLKDIEKGVMQLVMDNGGVLLQRPTTNQLIDDRGNLLNDWSASYLPSYELTFTEERLRFY
jgi:phage gp36-like protein